MPSATTTATSGRDDPDGDLEPLLRTLHEDRVDLHLPCEGVRPGCRRARSGHGPDGQTASSDGPEHQAALPQAAAPRSRRQPREEFRRDDPGRGGAGGGEEGGAGEGGRVGGSLGDEDADDRGGWEDLDGAGIDGEEEAHRVRGCIRARVEPLEIAHRLESEGGGGVAEPEHVGGDVEDHGPHGRGSGGHLGEEAAEDRAGEPRPSAAGRGPPPRRPSMRPSQRREDADEAEGEGHGAGRPTRRRRRCRAATRPVAAATATEAARRQHPEAAHRRG